MATYNLKTFLTYVAEAVDKFGYIKSWNDFGANENSTWKTAQKFYDNDTADYDSKNPDIDAEKSEIGFEANKASNDLLVEDAINWILSVNPDNDYTSKLQAAVKNDRITNKELGIVASLIPTYKKHLDYVQKKEAEARELKSLNSKHVGEVGQKIVINVKSVELVTSWDSSFGIVFLYRILDMDNNIFVWKTGNILGDECLKLQGTVKEHTSYDGIPQTVLTRCKELA